MLHITKTKIHLGLTAPVKILHVTDVHLTVADELDSVEHHELMKKRTEVFRKEGSFPQSSPLEYFEEAFALAKAENALLVCTGDAIDIHTHGNVQLLQSLFDGKDLMFSPGGHEHQRICRRTMEEPYPYWETIRPQLESEFPAFDLSFEARVQNGLQIITADNSLDYFSKKTVDAFKSALAKGLPTVVFFHDPIWDSILNKTEAYHPNVRLTEQDYKTSHEMLDLLLHHPLIIATFAGHGHNDDERIIVEKTHYMTAGLFKGKARMIEFI